MLGLDKGVVKLVSHNEQWHHLFAEEKARLHNAAGEYVIAIEHVGSTSICGISAKPIIDIAVAIESREYGERCIKPLENLGYEYRGERGIAGRFYFVKGEPRTAHLHMVEIGSDFWKSHLLFRDYLRQNPIVAKQYENLKTELAQMHSENREAYTDGKAIFIENLLKTKRGLKLS